MGSENRNVTRGQRSYPGRDRRTLSADSITTHIQEEPLAMCGGRDRRFFERMMIMGKILLPNPRPKCLCGAMMRSMPVSTVPGGVVWKCERCQKIELRAINGKPMRGGQRDAPAVFTQNMQKTRHIYTRNSRSRCKNTGKWVLPASAGIARRSGCGEIVSLRI